MIRFIAELYRRGEYKPERAIAASVTTDQEGRIVSKIDCTFPYPTTGYWIDWGGYYDNLENNKIAVFYNGYLGLVESIALLIFSGSSLYRHNGDTVYIATDLFPWQYPECLTEVSVVEPYSSAVSNLLNPSDDTYDDRRHPTYLKIPSLEIKLPDAISGSALQYATFNIDLQNEDGNFDLIDDNNFFNTPVYVLKSVVDNPSYSDFQIIRRGFSDNFKVGFTGFQVVAATVYRSLSEEVCKSINLSDYPDAGNEEGKKIPVAWGSVTVDAIQVADYDYIFIDPDYLVSIDTVYDNDGAEISNSDYTILDGVLTMETEDTPSTADITALADNKIGQIITTEMQDKSRILYGTDLWDITETDDYIIDSPAINFIWDGGSVRELIAEILKSDNAFLIEKSNGKLSLRSWGGRYTTHNLDSWVVTQEPTKEHINSKYFLSSARVKYGDGEILDSSVEKEIVEKYRKSQILEFETHLATKTAAENLAKSLVDRFASRNEEYRVSIGTDTFGISLLDNIVINLTINGRQLTRKNLFVVKSIDPAQDTMTIEAVGTVEFYSGLLATPAGIDYNGDMSGYAVDSGAKLAQIYYRE